MYLAELPWRRGCSVIRGAPRGLFSFFSVLSNKAPFALPPIMVSSVFCAQKLFFGPSLWGPVKVKHLILIPNQEEENVKTFTGRWENRL